MNCIKIEGGVQHNFTLSYISSMFENPKSKPWDKMKDWQLEGFSFLVAAFSIADTVFVTCIYNMHTSQQSTLTPIGIQSSKLEGRNPTWVLYFSLFHRSEVRGIDSSGSSELTRGASFFNLWLLYATTPEIAAQIICEIEINKLLYFSGKIFFFYSWNFTHFPEFPLV